MPDSRIGATHSSSRRVARARRTLLAIAMIMFVLKIVVATRVYGTNDTAHWGDFVRGVRERGPIGVYGLHFRASLYNHPPLTGYLLELVNGLTHLGPGYMVWIRGLASASDVISALLVFELLRVRSTTYAFVGGLVVALAPTLFIISGFHGNTDPVFTMLVILAGYLFTVRSWPLLGGLVFGLAFSIKIVPLILVPALLIYSLRRGPRYLIWVVSGLAAVVLVLWLPVYLTHARALTENVLGYSGIGSQPQWGLALAGQPFGLSQGWLLHARSILGLLSAVLPAVLVYRRPEALVPAFAVGLIASLAFSPAFAMQYLVWAAVASVLIDVRIGAVYNLAVGLLTVHVYNRWSGGLPWNVARASPLIHTERMFGVIGWLSLIVALILALRPAWTAPGRSSRHRPSTPGGNTRVTAS